MTTHFPPMPIPGEPLIGGAAPLGLVEWTRQMLLAQPCELTLITEQVALLQTVETLRATGEAGSRWPWLASPRRRSGLGDLDALHIHHASTGDLEDDVGAVDGDHAADQHYDQHPDAAAQALGIGVDLGVDADDADDDGEFDDETDSDAGRDGAGPADLLTRIDELTGPMCACGQCGQRIKPNGPSEFFASRACQRRWHGQQADDPADVYRRRDAARPYESNDQLPVPLQEADGNYYRPAEPPPPAELPRMRSEPLPPCDDTYGAAYRRRCPQCEQQVMPDVYTFDPVELQETFEALPLPSRRAQTTIYHRCPHCRSALPDPAYIPEVTTGDGRIVLELRDESSRARRAIPLRHLQRSGPACGELLRGQWALLEQQLAKFRRAWLGNHQR